MDTSTTSNYQKVAEELKVLFKDNPELRDSIITTPEIDDGPKFYCIVKTELTNDNKQFVLHVTQDYTDCVLKFHETYKEFVSNEDYIIREVNALDVMIYERVAGWIWDDKTPFCTYRVISHNL